jgi:hypothetical protein
MDASRGRTEEEVVIDVESCLAEGVKAEVEVEVELEVEVEADRFLP